MASFRNYLPFADARISRGKGKAQPLQDTSTLAKLVKIASLALGFSGGAASKGRAQFEDAPYDFDRIIQAIDTDSYVKQAFAKYKELLWKEGWQIVAEDPEVVEYLRMRIDLMEMMMQKSFQEVLTEVGDQLVKYANGFLAKARGDITPYFPGSTLTPITGKDTISGYYVVPTETIKIQRDVNNVVQGYQQDAEGGGGGTKLPEWKPEDMIHFSFDRKPGRVFGTPFIISVLDDIIALRQIEEDVQNLVHRELFPLYVYKVGTEDDPADPDEIENASQELSNLRTEGGLIIPERHDVEVLGAESNALQADAYLRYFQERVVAGLGLAPHHLGIMNAGGNRAVTDRLDIALYDKVKTFQRYMQDVIRIMIFNELLMEGGFDPINLPEHRAFFKFNEIDTDTQIKKDAAEIQKWTNNLSMLGETRLRIGEKTDVDESQLFAALQARMTPDTTATAKTATGATTTTTVDTTPSAAKKGDAQEPSKGGKPNARNGSRGVGNQVRPQNQHGRRMSPNVRHSMEEKFLDELVDLLDDE